MRNGRSLQKAPHRAVVLCGPGNNGGDGFVVARLLKEWGWEVEVFLYGDAEKLPRDAKVNYERWCALGDVTPFLDDAYDEDPHEAFSPTLIIDALLGIGLTRPPDFDCANLFHYIEDTVVYSETSAKVVSIDVPTGLDADSGRTLDIKGAHPPHCVIPDLTVTFHAPKIGHYLADGPKVCGKVSVVDIGL